MRKRRRDGEAGVDLSVQLGPLRLASAIVSASGTFGLGDEYLRNIDPRRLGAFTTKSLSIFPWPGNPPPRIAATPAGMINSIGLDNPGVDEWIESCLPAVKRHGVPIIGSVWGRTPEEFAAAATRIASYDPIVAIEVNLSCPNVEEPGEMIAHSVQASEAVISAVTEATKASGKPVFAKLSPNVPSALPFAEAVLEAGATGLTLINTVLGLVIDPERAEPVLKRSVGGLSGPAIKPIALRHVYEVSTALDAVPIIGTGGVFNGCDAAEMLMAGASAVGVGTASFYDPKAPQRIAEELESYLKSRNFGAAGDILGIARRETSP